jgi:hypothetical protein
MARDRQVAAYERLAIRWIANNCTQGQQLVVHSPNGDQIDELSLTNVAGALCTASEVRRVAVDKKGFELRCAISKFDRVRDSYLAAEAAQTTDAYLQQLRSAPGKTVNEDSIAGQPRATTTDCSKMNMAVILTSGPCR